MAKYTTYCSFWRQPPLTVVAKYPTIFCFLVNAWIDALRFGNFIFMFNFVIQSTFINEATLQ